MYLDIQQYCLGKTEWYLWKANEETDLVGIEGHFTNGVSTNKAWMEYS